MRSCNQSINPRWADLLRKAVNEPGVISTAYCRFHSYSLGNQLLALAQCEARGIEPGPLATFPRWKDLGRYVRKGEKALTLCMPITIKRRDKVEKDGERFNVSWPKNLPERAPSKLLENDVGVWPEWLAQNLQFVGHAVLEINVRAK